MTDVNQHLTGRDIETCKAVLKIILALTLEAQNTLTPDAVVKIAQAVDHACGGAWQEGWDECKEEFDIN